MAGFGFGFGFRVPSLIGVAPAYDLDFIGNTGIAGLAMSRASIGTAQASDGSWQTFAANQLRRTNRGLLIESARTNVVANSTMVGAVPGTPGVSPTGWQAAASSVAGITTTIVETGVADGINYIRYRIFGTPVTGSGNWSVKPIGDGAAAVAAGAGQAWTASAFVSLAGGSTAGTINTQVLLAEWTAANAFITLTGALTSGAGGTLGGKRTAVTVTTSGTTAKVSMGVIVYFAATPVAVDMMIDVGWPQDEAGAFASSPIPTSAGAVTRAADAISMPVSLGSAFSGLIMARGQMQRMSSVSLLRLTDGINFAEIGTRPSPNEFGLRLLDGTNVAGAADGVIAADTRFRTSFSYAAADERLSVNGAAPIQNTAAGARTPTSAIIGAGTLPWDGYIERVALFAGAQTNAQLQAA